MKKVQFKSEKYWYTIYKEVKLLIKTWRAEDSFQSSGLKKSFIAVDLKPRNIPLGNRITLENDMKAVKIHECLKRSVRLKGCHLKTEMACWAQYTALCQI